MCQIQHKTNIFNAPASVMEIEHETATLPLHTCTQLTQRMKLCELEDLLFSNSRHI